MFVFIKYLV